MRLWAAKYNSDWPRVESEVSAQAGTRLHALAENYLTTGAQPDRHDAFGELFIEALPHLPPPHSGVCEGRQEALIGGLPFVFVQDWYGPSAWVPGAPDGMPATIDHKTSKDPKRYGIWGKAKHLDNPQTLVYLARGAAEHGASEVFGRWLYYQKTTALLAWEREQYLAQAGTDLEVIARYDRALSQPRKPRVIPSDVVLTRDEIRGGLERVVLPLGEKLYRLREKGKVDPLTLPPNPAECEAFGGCPHRKRCNLSVQEQTKGYFSMTNDTPASAPPTFDLFKKLPPVNGPSAAPAPVSVGQPTVNAPPALAVPVWTAPSQSAPVVPAIPQATVNAAIEAINRPDPSLTRRNSEPPTAAPAASVAPILNHYDSRAHDFLRMIEEYGNDDHKIRARVALKAIAAEVFATL